MKIFVLLLAICILGCGEDISDTVELGMTPDEVDAILGAPLDIDVLPFLGLVYHYPIQSIYFVDDVVVKIVPDRTRARQTGRPNPNK